MRPSPPAGTRAVGSAPGRAGEAWRGVKPWSRPAWASGLLDCRYAASGGDDVGGRMARPLRDETTVSDPQPEKVVYALGSDPAERDRLRRQSEELGAHSAALLDKVGVGPGW